MISDSSRGAASERSHGCRPWLKLSQLRQPRSGERIFRRSAAHGQLETDTTAPSRGYSLTPLRG